MKARATLLLLSLLLAPPAFGASPAEVTAGVVRAAEALIDTLDASQKEAFQFSFDDEEQRRRRWSNLPVTAVERRGLRMGDLSDEQKEAVLGVLEATLSESGYRQIIDNVNGDEVLRQRGGRDMFGKDQFFFSILGEPSESEPWMWQFGGHHLAVNATIVGDQITLSPTLTGGQPVDFEFEGRSVRQLANEEDLAFTLVGSMSSEQLAQTVVGDHHVNLVFGPGADDVEPRKEGVLAAELNDYQKAMLLDLIRERVGILNETHAQIAMQKIEAQLPETYFAWFGPTEPGAAATFRIQGPSVVIEYSPQHLGGDATMHTHAMYRDPSNDYGAAYLSGR